jgi:hypothetical protein
VVYSKNGFFEDNGVSTLQVMPVVPHLSSHTWLVPVGQAYHISLNLGITDSRFIAFTYLQRDVPEGYEHTLNLYFLPDRGEQWQRLPSRRFVENLVVADLQTTNGTYVVMSTLEMPQLRPGWNLLVYPLADTRLVSEALHSIDSAYTIVYQDSSAGQVSPPDSTAMTNVSELTFGGIYWIWIEGSEVVTPYFAPPQRQSDGLLPGSRQGD